jgi:uncharacterized protein (TIGR02145 family)
MSMKFFTRQVRTLLIAAVMAALSVGTIGCGDDSGANSGGGDGVGSNTCGKDGTAGSCKTVSIGGQTWMAENLNLQTADSWCYENSAANCAKYGRLYTWNAAKKACQLVGMRLPSREEWDALIDVAGGNETAGRKLKSTSGWNDNGNGTNETGFSALPDGYRRFTGWFDLVGEFGLWWTDEEFIGSAYYRSMTYGDDRVDETNRDKADGLSARCLQDN